MSGIFLTRLKQGRHTIRYPAAPPPSMPERFTGRPEINVETCRKDCEICIQACPTGALTRVDGTLQIDLGLCIFCGKCQTVCPTKSIAFTPDYRLAACQRQELVTTQGTLPRRTPPDQLIPKIFGRSLKLRQVSAGGCNACEADTNVLTTLAWDLSRFGIHFEASPRHADGILVTGPVSKNMELALQKTYAAVAKPKIVVVVGACAIAGGVYAGHEETCSGVEGLLPVDLYVPGCPPHPLTILDGLLMVLDRLPPERL